MKARPMIAYRVLHSTPQEWFGRSLQEVEDADLWRWYACVEAAKKVIHGR